MTRYGYFLPRKRRCPINTYFFECLSHTVGDSPRGPLKQLGNPRLKPATKPNTLYLTMQDMAHAAETPAAHQDGPLEDPLEQASPRSRMRASLGRAPPRSRGCAYLERTSPRSRVRSTLERGPPRSRALRTRARSRTRAFNALTAAGRRHHAPGARAPVPPHQLPKGSPSPLLWEGLCGVAGASPVTPRRLLWYG
jgi:hypothetical protein